MDHQKFLGDTIEEIAVQKAGIITNAAPVVTVQESSEALQVIQNRCEEKKAPLYVLNRKEISGLSCEAGETKFCIPGGNVYLRMCGQYQVENACLALLALQVLESLPPEIIQKGMAEARWLGRFDYVKKSPVWSQTGHTIRRGWKVCWHHSDRCIQTKNESGSWGYLRIRIIVRCAGN